MNTTLDPITDDTRFRLTPAGIAALDTAPGGLLDTGAAVETVRQCWDGTTAQPKPEWCRGTCPLCAAPLVSNCYYIGGRGFIVIHECWESLRPVPACNFRKVL